MKKVPLLEKRWIEPANLVGTKWIGWSEFIGDQMTVEFVDNTNCVYTSYKKKFPMKYTVADSSILFSEIPGTFVLSGQVLFNNGIPAFEKAA